MAGLVPVCVTGLLTSLAMDQAATTSQKCLSGRCVVTIVKMLAQGSTVAVIANSVVWM